MTHRWEHLPTARTSTSSKVGSKRTGLRTGSATSVCTLLASHWFPLTLLPDVEAVDGIIENLLYVSPQRGLLYVTDTSGDARYPSGKLEHLSCFLAGLLALGHATLPSPPDTHLWAAQGLATTCWLTYADTATGLGPDEVSFRPPSGGDPEEYARWSRGEFKWVHALQKWEDGGRVGPVPGTADVEPITDHEDIEAREWSTNGRTGYLLRPEASPPRLSLTSSDVLTARADGRVAVHPAPRHARPEVARARLADL
jgi:hypothetical protein